MLTDTSEKPKYLQLVESLRRQIDSGELQPGDRLPSYTEMRKIHGLTQPTIDRGHAILEKDGYIERVARKGVFVSAPNTTKAEVSKHNLLNGSVIVLTQDAATRWKHHRQTGWSEYIPLGAINEIRTSSLHVMSLDPNNLQNSDIEYFLQRPPAGVIIIGDSNLPASMLETAMRMQEVKIPVVVYGDGPELTSFDRVISDHEQGSYELTKWLIERGCQRILQTRPEGADTYWSQMRDKGYLRAMKQADLPLLKTGVYAPFAPADNDRALFERSVQAMAAYLTPHLSKKKPVEAIMAVTDGEVYALAAACRLLGKTPNKDVLFVGYDHYWEDAGERAMESTTPLATIDKRNPEIGAALVKLLKERIEGRLSAEPQLRLLTPRLIVH